MNSFAKCLKILKVNSRRAKFESMSCMHRQALTVGSVRWHLFFRYLVHVVALLHAKFGSDLCLPLSDALLDAPPSSVIQATKIAHEAADSEAVKVRAAKELELQDLAALHTRVCTSFGMSIAVSCLSLYLYACSLTSH
jgi:hypothetical protein